MLNNGTLSPGVIFLWTPSLLSYKSVVHPPPPPNFSSPTPKFTTPSLLLWVLPTHLHWEAICALDFRVAMLGVIWGGWLKYLFEAQQVSDAWSTRFPPTLFKIFSYAWLLFSSHVFTFGLNPILFTACVTKETLSRDRYLQLYLQEGYCTAWFIAFQSFLLTHTQRVPLELYLQIRLYCFFHFDDPM